MAASSVTENDEPDPQRTSTSNSESYYTNTRSASSGNRELHLSPGAPNTNGSQGTHANPSTPPPIVDPSDSVRMGNVAATLGNVSGDEPRRSFTVRGLIIFSLAVPFLTYIITECMKTPPFALISWWEIGILVAAVLASAWFILPDFFVWCSGASSIALAAEPDEQAKQRRFGFTICTTAILACFSGGYALFTVFHSVPLAIGLGCLWGAMIFGIDRLIVSTMRHPGTGSPFLTVLAAAFIMALPRLVLAAGIGIVVAKPLELKLLAGPISDRMKEDRRAEVLGQDAILQRNIKSGLDSKRAQLLQDNAKLKDLTDRYNKLYNNYEWYLNSGYPTAAHEMFPDVNQANTERLAAKQTYDKLTQTIHDLDEQHSNHAQEVAESLSDEALESSLISKNTFLYQFIALEELRSDKTKPAQARTTGVIDNGIMWLLLIVEMVPTLVKTFTFFSPRHPYDDVLNSMDDVRSLNSRYALNQVTDDQQRQEQERRSAREDEKIVSDDKTAEIRDRIAAERDAKRAETREHRERLAARQTEERVHAQALRRLEMDAELANERAVLQGEQAVVERLVAEWQSARVQYINSGGGVTSRSTRTGGGTT